uniref:Uncharacterized protein n=1 Tax=viral metagenome TaxID=1070528 RepID=A0A6H1ZC85_9ZZZZ
MKQQITITKSWYDALLEEIKSLQGAGDGYGANQAIAQLVRHVESLDVYFKEEE